MWDVIFDQLLQKPHHHYYWKGQNKKFDSKPTLIGSVAIFFTELSMLCREKLF
jgi:hypothetical protein